MIQIEESLKLAEGGTRTCFLHPNDKTKVIKIAKKNKTFFRLNGNQQEWKHYQYLQKKFKSTEFLIKCYGYQKTSLGNGLVFECMRDHDGNLSKTLKEIFFNKNHGYDEKRLLSAITDFCDMLIEENIQFFDLNLGNLALKISPNQSYQVFAVDIKGRYANHELIPVSTYIPFFSRRKLRRRTTELKLQIDLILETRKK